jgi:DNA-directed RNA polymerase subunit RPC12/RpoP
MAETTKVEIGTSVDWIIPCWWCKKTFLSSESTKTKEELVVCPHCQGWSGFEMRRKRPVAVPTRLDDPGQDRLINELFAWIVVDPKTNLEGICGIMVDGCPRLAVTTSRTEAVRLCASIKAAKQQTGKMFRLVRYEQSLEAEMEL